MNPDFQDDFSRRPAANLAPFVPLISRFVADNGALLAANCNENSSNTDDQAIETEQEAGESMREGAPKRRFRPLPEKDLTKFCCLETRL